MCTTLYSYITAYANNLVLIFLPWHSWVVADGSPRVIAQLRSTLCVLRLQSGALPETLIMPPTVEDVYWFHAQHLTLTSQQIILLDLNTVNGVFHEWSMSLSCIIFKNWNILLVCHILQPVINRGVQSVYTGVRLFLPVEFRPVSLQPGKNIRDTGCISQLLPQHAM